MIIGVNQVETVLKVLEDMGALDDQTHGQIYCSAVPKAFTYQRKGLV